jgi:glycerol uptake facilitator-like aquaporin
LPVSRDDYGKGRWGDCQLDAEAVAVSATCGRSAILEPISTALAGIALVKSSVDFIKSNISTAQDIGQIAGQIDALFTGQKQVQEASNKKSGVGLADQFGVQSVAKEMIDARLAAEQIAEVARMVDFRFGHGTWAGILAERQKRIQQAKEARAAQRKMEQLRQQEMFENFKVGAIAVGLVVVIIGLFIGVLTATAGVIVK